MFFLSSLVTRLEDKQVVFAGYLTIFLHTVVVNLREYILVPPASPLADATSYTTQYIYPVYPGTSCLSYYILVYPMLAHIYRYTLHYPISHVTSFTDSETATSPIHIGPQRLSKLTAANFGILNISPKNA